MDDTGRPRRPDDLPMPAGYGYFQQPLQGQASQQEQQQRQQQQQQQQNSRAWPTRANLGNVRSFRPEPSFGRSHPTPPGMPSSRNMSSSGVYGDSPYYQESTSNAYASSTMPQGGLGYHQPASAGYGHQADPRQAQSYSASSYHPASTMMYNVSQATSTPSTSMYDANQSFPSRQPAGLQVSPAEAASHFSYQNGSPNVSAATSGLRPDTASSNAPQNVYQQQHGLQNYTTAMSSIGGMAPQSATTPDVSMDEQASPTDDDPQRSFAHYESILKETFRDIKDSGLVAASEHLMSATAELLDGLARWGMYFSFINHGTVLTGNVKQG
jgi:hypothetical protein